MNLDSNAKPVSNWLSWARLLRLPNVFSAFADIALGFAVLSAVTAQSLAIDSLLIISLASGLLYLSGMVFNDLFDRDVDAVERPERPLPSGRISTRSATVVAVLLMLGGIAVSSTGGAHTTLVAIALGGCILGYDGGLKRTALGPIAMGGCRLLNVLLGMAAAVSWEQLTTVSPLYLLGIPAANGLYIVGVTWFAREEASVSNRRMLQAASLLILTAFAVHGYILIDAGSNLVAYIAGALFVGFLGSKLLVAISDPSPKPVQSAVKAAVLGLIPLDAVISLAFQGPIYGSCVFLLLFPALLLGRWIYST